MLVILLFFLGTLGSYFIPTVASFLLIIPLILAAVIAACLRIKFLSYPAVLLCGCLWGLLHASCILSWHLPSDLENRPILIKGDIVTIPARSEAVTSFDFRLQELSGKPCSAKLRLHWRQCPYRLRVADQWQLWVVLKRPYGLRNPGGSDLERNYFQQHIRAVGTVKHHPKNIRLNRTMTLPIQKIRQYLLSQIPKPLNDSPYLGILLALSLGITSSISPQQWAVFRATGTNHLVAISGLHIGLLAGFAAKLVGFFWSRYRYGPLLIPVPQIQAISGLIAAFCYSLLAGFSASTQRAFFMIMVATAAKFTARKISTVRALILALGFIILLDPFAPLAVGFWLSFIAVGLLVFGLNARIASEGLWWQWGRPQWVVCVGMLPSLISFFQQLTLLSVPANLIAIPWVSFVVVPCCLLGVAISPVSQWLATMLLKAASISFNLLWVVLRYIANCHYLIFQYSFTNTLQVICSHIAAYLSVLPAGLVSRLLVLFWWLPCFFMPVSRLKADELQLTVLDVGQGLAVVVRTAEHVLVYDTGVKFDANNDMGKAVVIPFLRSIGVARIDLLTISHGDNDHSGGALSVLQAFPVTKLITSVPARFSAFRPQMCQAGISWQWNGMTFRFLSPQKTDDLQGNNASCVLQICNGRSSILLTGDIEREAEAKLVARYGHHLHATVLLAPHHGSQTSSSSSFLTAVAPSYVVFPCGYANRYHHPHAKIWTRYVASGAILVKSFESGAITMTLKKDSDKVAWDQYRISHRRIWHN